MGYNKIIYGEKTIVDLTGDTVDSSVLFSGKIAHDKSGNSITGTLFDQYPKEIRIPIKETANLDIGKKEKNIVFYNGEKIFDISDDTVDEESLLYGYTCHKANGEIISGKFLENYPLKISFNEPIKDSKNDFITDNLGNTILSEIIYSRGERDGNYFVYTR